MRKDTVFDTWIEEGIVIHQKKDDNDPYDGHMIWYIYEGWNEQK